MDHPPSPILMSKFSRSLQARKRKQKSYAVKNKSSDDLDNVIEKIVDNNDIISNTVKEIENCLQIVKSTESQFSIHDAEILNNNLDSRINSLHEIESVIKKENDYLDVSIALQNNVLNYVHGMQAVKEEKTVDGNYCQVSSSCNNVPETSTHIHSHISKSINHISGSIVENHNSKNCADTKTENSLLDGYKSDEDLMDDGNDSKISDLVNTIMLGNKMYSSTPVNNKLGGSKKFARPFKTKSLNISEDSLNAASKLFEDMFESSIHEPCNTSVRRNFNSKPLKLNSSLSEFEMDTDCFTCDISDTQMNQIVDKAIVTHVDKPNENEFEGFDGSCVNNSQEIKQNFDENLNQWAQSYENLSQTSEMEFKGFHQVDVCHEILQNINLEIQRLKNSLPKVNYNKLKRLKSEDKTFESFTKKYRYSSLDEITNGDNRKISKNASPELKSAPDIGFHSTGKKHVEINNACLSKSKNLFHDLDIYQNVGDNELNVKPSRIPLKSDSNMSKKFEEVFKKPRNYLNSLNDSDSSFSTSTSELFSNQRLPKKYPIKLNQAARQRLTIKKLEEMEKSFKVAESVFTFHTDLTKNQKNEKMSKSVDRICNSYERARKNSSYHVGSNKNDANIFIDIAGCSNVESCQISPSKKEKSRNFSRSEKTLMEEENLFKMGENELDFSNKILSTTNASSFGFQTASNKQIHVNEKSLQKVENLFKNMDDQGDILANVQLENSTNMVSKTKSEINPLRNVDILFKDIHEISKSDTDFSHLSKSSVPRNETPSFFLSPSNKSAIKDNSLSNVHNLFNHADRITNTEHLMDSRYDFKLKDSSDMNIICPSRKVKDSSNKTENLYTGGFCGDSNMVSGNCNFQTASNKNIKTNMKSMLAAQNLLKDIENIDLENSKSVNQNLYKTLENQNESIQFNEPSNNFGFHTASNKKLETIHANALNKAENLFKDLETDVNTKNNYESSLKKVKLSESSNYKYDQGNELEASAKTVQFNDMGNFGFHTASNKKLEAINENALKKAENLFKDLETDVNTKNDFESGLKKVTISESSNSANNGLELSKKLIQFNELSNNFGFHTASNKKLEAVDKNALSKAENLFKDLETDDNVKNNFESDFNKVKSSKPSTSTNKNSFNEAENLFKDIFDEYSEEISKYEPEIKNNAKNKSKVKLSTPPSNNNNSVKKANDLFKDIFEEYSDEIANYETANIPPDTGQCTTGDNNDVYGELEKAVMCFENLDETTIKIPEENVISDKNVNSNIKIMNNMEYEDENDIFLDVIEDDDKMEDMDDDHSAQFSVEDTENQKSEYCDLEDTLIEDIDDFTDVGSIGSKSDLDTVSSKDVSKNRALNLTEIIKRNLNNLNDASGIALRKPTSDDLIQFSDDIKQQISDLKMLVSLLEEKKSHIDKIISLDSQSKNQPISFIPGQLSKQKQKNISQKISLRLAVKNRLPMCSDIISGPSSKRFSINLWDITPENACELHFYLPSPPNPPVIGLSDGAKLLSSTAGFVGLSEFKVALETMPGVDKTKIMKGWFENHYRWIVWKLASMDRQFPNCFSDQFLTPDNVMKQLKYRYDRDIYGNERSAIRKITEKDDVASRRMVLCVYKINISANNYGIEVCDGWYGVKTNLDSCLIGLVRRNKIKVGTKLITYGAELLNLSDPCHPLQAPESIRLKLHGNSTRRVKWDTKLGFQKNAGPFLTPLNSIQSSGGYIGRVIGFIARTFPLKYVEKMANEQWVCRCKRGEARRERVFLMEQDNIVEKAHHEALESLQKEWHEQSVSIIKENKNSSDIKNLTCPKKLSTLLEFSTDPSSISELLSPSQHKLVADYRSKLNAQRQTDISKRVQTILNSRGFAKRSVSSILQLIIVDANKPNLNNHYILEIWNPDDFILDVLLENSVICFLNLFSSNVRSENLLKATKQTRYLRGNKSNNINYQTCVRCYTSIRQMQLIDYHPPIKYCDTVGVVVKICNEDGLVKFVWLSDAHFRLLRIIYKMDSNNCLAFEGFNVGDIVAVFNLKLLKCMLGQGQAQIDYVTYVTKTPSKSQLDITTALQNLHNDLPASFNDFISDCDDKIEEWDNEINSKFY